LAFKIPEQIIEEVKSRNELVSVVEQYVRLEKRTGANFFGLCPFHSEDTPSFSVSPSKQIYHCFGCKKGGDVIRFIMDIEKCAYPQAIQLLAERAGVQIPEPDDEVWRQRQELAKAFQAIYLEAARHYYRNLVGESGSLARAYLQKRALSPATCRRFGLGFAPEEWDSLLRQVTACGFTDEALLLKSGLFRRGKTGSLYDLFRNRLMFPIMDAMGKIIAFGGRVLDDSQPKYINSPETPIYSKGRHLYALNLAKSSQKHHLVIVEGYMDAIALHQAGVDQTVASLGTALTESQAQLLRKYTDEVIIAYDADAAGQAATLRSLDVLRQRDLKVSVLQVPDGKDPDEFIRRNGPERFAALIDKALPLLDYKLLVVRQKHSSGDQLDAVGYQEEAVHLLAQEDNAIVRELYAARLADEIRTAPETVQREIERRHDQPAGSETVRRQAAESRHDPSPALPDASEPISREELYLLGLLAAQPALLRSVLPTAEDFSPGAIRTLAEAVLQRAAENRLDPSVLIDLCADLTVRGRPLHELMARVSMRLEELFGNQDLEQAALQQLLRQRRFRLRCQIDVLRHDLAQAQDDDEKDRLKQALLERTNQLVRIKQNPDWPGKPSGP
jgi:DNA primase